MSWRDHLTDKETQELEKLIEKREVAKKDYNEAYKLIIRRCQARALRLKK